MGTKLNMDQRKAQFHGHTCRDWPLQLKSSHAIHAQGSEVRMPNSKLAWEVWKSCRKGFHRYFISSDLPLPRYFGLQVVTGSPQAKEAPGMLCRAWLWEGARVTVLPLLPGFVGQEVSPDATYCMCTGSS